MTTYRKAARLRIRRYAAPEPPFWAASAIFPYGASPQRPVAIDYEALRAIAPGAADTAVSSRLSDDLDRARNLEGPVFIDASAAVERIYRCGAEALAWCDAHDLAATLLVGPEVPLPDAHGDHVLAVAAWPPDIPRLEAAFADAGARYRRWGVVVPVVFPLTTESGVLAAIADAAARHGASFLGGFGIASDPAARQAIAAHLNLDPQDDRYALLFHSRGSEPLQLPTERHIAALAAARGLADFVPAPRAETSRDNWSAAVLLTRVAARMLSVELDLDLAGRIARSARLVAGLDKPLTRIAASARLSIVEGLDETSVAMLEEWLAGRTVSFAGFVDEEWRLERA